MRRQKTPWGRMLRGLLLPLLAAAVLLGFSTALNSLDSGRDEEDKRQLERAIRRGCLACYAAEGVYPPDLDYLRDHYGLQIDEERYTVKYSVFAENLMPDFTVLENTP